tara:strand:- start:470 stop:679 length:210 start_codon:yes stop_codon:yes gene_type:complete
MEPTVFCQLTALIERWRRRANEEDENAETLRRCIDELACVVLADITVSLPEDVIDKPTNAEKGDENVTR